MGEAIAQTLAAAGFPGGVKNRAAMAGFQDIRLERPIGRKVVGGDGRAAFG